VSFFLHAVEDSTYRWTCRRGTGPADGEACDHGSVDEALRHLRQVAKDIAGNVRIVMHFGDGETRFEPQQG
jgi:hypothetical protein